ncbi:MAG: hypothetical protein KC503_47530, partial [Myxococcales bacterium]|nr:hypothetical protein [Myxococcales bacterium]
MSDDRSQRDLDQARDVKPTPMPRVRALVRRTVLAVGFGAALGAAAACSDSTGAGDANTVKDQGSEAALIDRGAGDVIDATSGDSTRDQFVRYLDGAGEGPPPPQPPPPPEAGPPPQRDGGSEGPLPP